ncbi:MAG: ribosome recycling factor [Pseudomonadota bacterium]
MAFDIKDLRQRMDGAYTNLEKEFSGLRTGRASVNMLEPVMVDAYGSKMPLNQVGSVSVPESRLLVVQVWDASMSKAVEKAIRESGLGLNPQAEGTMIRVPIPELNQERRAEMTKVAGKYAEQTRIAIRNIRRDGMETLKTMEKGKQITEDELKRLSEDVQKLTDEVIARVDKLLADKETDIMKV